MRHGVWVAYYIEHEETGRNGDDSAGIERCQAVRNRGHCMLADPPVDVAASIIAVDSAGSAKVGLSLVSLYADEGEGFSVYVLEILLILPNQADRGR